MKLNFRLFALFLTVSGLLGSCNPDPIPEPVTPVNPNPNPNPTPVPTGNAICISFENFVGNDPLILDQQLRYMNLNGDSFSVEVYKYYISNIAFTDNLGNTWYEPESYHLINAEDTNSYKVYVDSMPAGNYTSVSFMIGVDSTRNVSGTQSGALDPANSMFWTWSSGYIMAKMEGRSPSSTTSFNLVVVHIGGFAGQYAGQRWAVPSFGASTAMVTANTVPKIHMKSDLNEWFQTPYAIDFSSSSNISTPGNMSVGIADNYVDMFTITGIEN